MSLNASFAILGSFIDSGGNAKDSILAAVPYDSARGKFNVANLPDGNSLVLALVAPTIYQLYLKNLDASQSITVTWTPVSGVSSIDQVLAPGSVLLLWDIVGQGGGVTAVSIQASGAGNVNYEYFNGA